MPNSRDIVMTLEMGGEGSATNAEAWAVGERHGVAVESGDPTYHNNSKYYSQQAAGSATGAETAEENAEAWAVGQRNGTDVGSTDPTYHNNSQYYAGQAGGKSEDAEAWAVGKRNGTDVGSDDPTYHNNSKYHAEQASGSATTATTAKNDAVAAKNRAVAAEGHYPKIQNGTWWVWDVSNETWTDTTIKATGDAWHVVKTYASYAAMVADYSGTDTDVGDYVMIVSTVEDPDNAKVYIKGSQAWQFVVDMSGATGIQGPKGDTGAVPDIQVGQVTSGSTASVTRQQGSPDTAPVFDFVLPKGDTGATGATGATGETGPAPDLSFGTVTMAEPGTQASITRRSGTPDTAPVFDMVIPKGDKGDQGPKGDTGSIDNATGDTLLFASGGADTIHTVVDSYYNGLHSEIAQTESRMSSAIVTYYNTLSSEIERAARAGMTVTQLKGLE